MRLLHFEPESLSGRTLDEVRALDAELFSDGSVAPDFGSTAHWWVVRDAGKVIAYASARPGQQLPSSVYLSRVGVAVPYRGLGLQRRLIRARLRWAWGRPSAAVYTSVAPWNLHSANNLIRCGFELWDPPIPWSDEGTLYFIRRVA